MSAKTENDKLAVARQFLGFFEKTLDHYHLNCTRRSSATIVERLKILRKKLAPFLDSIADVFIETMQTAPNLIRLNEIEKSYVCFGDLHGSLTDLVYLRQTFWRDEHKLKQSHFVFLGDYVDRGIHGYEVAVYLILLKLVYPGNYTILRGNHEISWMNRGFFLRECQLKFGKKPGTAAWRTLNQCFSMLPYAALINQNVLCCHGGFPRKLRSLEDIDTKIPKGLVNEHHNVLALQLLWNDFRSPEYNKRRCFHKSDDLETESESEGTSSTVQRQTSDKEALKYFVANSIRRIGYIIGHKAVGHFLTKHGLKYIVRAHQFDETVSAQGFNMHSHRRVLTLFSNSSYVGTGNSTACVRISPATSSINIIKLRSEEAHNFNSSEIFECDELADMKFDW